MTSRHHALVRKRITVLGDGTTLWRAALLRAPSMRELPRCTPLAAAIGPGGETLPDTYVAKIHLACALIAWKA